MSGSEHALVAAFGHAWLGDEAFGLKVIDRLRHDGVPPRTVLADWSFGTITAFQRLCEGHFRQAVFVASASRGRPAGQLYRCPVDGPLPDDGELHARIADCAMGLVSLDNLLFMARYYGVLPPRVLVLEAEPVLETWSDQLSPDVAALVPEAVREILVELTSM